LIGLAVNVTEVPGQILFADPEMVTDGTTTSFTVIVMMLLVTLAGEGHVALDVMMTVTLSVLTKVALVNVALFVPAFTPFTCH